MSNSNTQTVGQTRKEMRQIWNRRIEIATITAIWIIAFAFIGYGLHRAGFPWR